MYLTHLSLSEFRNFSRLDQDVPRGPLLLVGSNAQGKTSLLEAIYFLATFESFHATSDRQLVNFLANRQPLVVARIVADFKRSDSDKTRVKTQRLEIRLILEPNGGNGSRLKKEVLLNGVRKKVGEVIGQFNAVLFLPQMLRIVEGSPEERRRYLNLALSQVYPGYAQALSEYNQVITQRNALLKRLAENGWDASASEAQLLYWDGLLAARGALLIHTRTQAVLELERLAAHIHLDLTRGQEVLRLDYQPSYDPLPQPAAQFMLPLDAPLDRSHLSLEKIQQGFIQRLASLRQEEISRGVTTIGPHRDELRFLANGIDQGTYGSRGQARTLLLSLKLAEVDWMRQKTGQWPVLLLDEVLAELDPLRRQDLLNRLAQCEQALLTTTDLDLFSQEFVNRAQLWRVEAGRVVTVTANA